MGGQWELCTRGSVGGPVRWGTNGSCVPRVTLGDQWHGGPMRTGWKGSQWGINEMGDQWEMCTQSYTGGPVTWGTNETMRTVYPGWGVGGAGTNESGDQWDGWPMDWVIWVLIGGPMRWGTNKMGDQWDGAPSWWTDNGCTNEKGVNEKWNQWVQAM